MGFSPSLVDSHQFSLTVAQPLAYTTVCQEQSMPLLRHIGLWTNTRLEGITSFKGIDYIGFLS